MKFTDDKSEAKKADQFTSHFYIIT